jgi:FdhE protein
MTVSVTALDGLKSRRPEWRPWLAVVEEVLREAENPAWESAVPSQTNAGQPEVPLLVGAAISVPASSVRRLFERLVSIALVNGTPKLATLERALTIDLDVLALFTASLSQDGDRLSDIADASGADAEALHAMVALLCVPLLQACNRQLAPAIPVGWREGYCPLCGSWPAFAEVRGIERNRCLRCGRCGCAWPSPALRCAYCRTSDHHRLFELVPENDKGQAVIAACTRCGGFLKTFTVLQGCSPGAVMLEDLASVDLDVAAVEQGYVRPTGAGYPLDVTVTDHAVPRRIFFWKR